MLSYANGKYIHTSALNLPVAKDIIGTIRGFRIFTACRTLGNKIFRLEDHIERLFNSAQAIYMELPHNKDRLREIIQATVAKNRKGQVEQEEEIGQKEKKDLLLEIIYSGGEAAPNGIRPAGLAVLYIAVFSLKLPPDNWYQEGIKLATYAYQRQWPEIKFLNYVGAVIAHQTVVKKYEADDALFISPHEKKIILEGTTFNFFIIKNGVIVTHPADGKILPGITRKVALELACQQGIKTKEDYFSLNDLLEVEEAFITSSTRNIVPVVRVDDIVIGSGQPGEITNKLARFFKEYQANY